MTGYAKGWSKEHGERILRYNEESHATIIVAGSLAGTRGRTYPVQMGTGTTFLSGRNRGKGVYGFSHDLLVGCREFAEFSKAANDNNAAFSMNIACALFGGSYLEARLNEEIAQMANGPGRKIRPTRKFWTVLYEDQKDMAPKQKWNLIASTYRGRLWDPSVEPFQSYDLVLSLRNELAHYKGIVTRKSDPPVKKLRALMARFKGPRDPMMKAFRVASWVDELLSAPEPGSWVAGVIEHFDVNFDLLLFGRSPKSVKVRRLRLP
jgi:hypothetical protein